MTGPDTDFSDALRYAIRNCPARTTDQLTAIDQAERAIRQGLTALSPLERKTLALELGFWLTHYQRIQEFSPSRPADADTRQTLAAPTTSRID